MSRTKVLIVDDEQDAVTSIKLIINEFCPELQLIGTANLIDDAWEMIKKNDPDLIFLDIDMTRGTGFDLLERFPIRKFDVIFITAYHEFESESASYGAFNYIYKPIDIDAFKNAVDKVIEHRKLNPGAHYKLGH
jgi:two-component system LytT family response regulator